MNIKLKCKVTSFETPYKICISFTAPFNPEATLPDEKSETSFPLIWLLKYNRYQLVFPLNSPSLSSLIRCKKTLQTHTFRQLALIDCRLAAIVSISNNQRCLHKKEHKNDAELGIEANKKKSQDQTLSSSSKIL
jgi:hypothetical protein